MNLQVNAGLQNIFTAYQDDFHNGAARDSGYIYGPVSYTHLMIYNGEEFYTSKRYDIDPIIDRVGGGDSCSGCIIHGLMTKPNQGAALEFAVAASALKHTINGDFNLVSIEEVEALAGGRCVYETGPKLPANNAKVSSWISTKM